MMHTIHSHSSLIIPKMTLKYMNRNRNCKEGDCDKRLNPSILGQAQETCMQIYYWWWCWNDTTCDNYELDGQLNYQIPLVQKSLQEMYIFRKTKKGVIVIRQNYSQKVCSKSLFKKKKGRSVEINDLVSKHCAAATMSRA